LTEEDLIAGCKKQDRMAQKTLYERFASKMLGLCRRYMGVEADAEDALLNGFYKAMSQIGTYEGKGNFEGWIRKIMVNECLMALRKRLRFQEEFEVSDAQLRSADDPMAILAAHDLMAIMARLPEGYRTVLNLHAIEGFKHHEIADMLGISINTSKSQLLLAKQKFRSMVGQHLYPEAS
jgi:RNA polymerase sigma-70 factor (ECF subfamily)